MTKLTRRQFGAGAVAAAAIVSSVGLSKPAKAKVMLKFANAANENYLGNIFMKSYFAEVAKRTSGEVDGQVFAGTLGGEETLLKGMALGTVDMYGGAYTATREFDIFYAAQFFRNYDHGAKVVNGPLRPKLNKLLSDRYKAQMIGVGRAGAFAIYGNDRMTDWMSLRGKKIRAGQIEGVLTGLRTIGANATPIPFNEVYSALQQKVVDGQVTLSSLAVTQKYYEVCKYAIANDFGLGFDKLMIADRVWEKLPPAQQKIMVDTFVEMEAAGWYKPVADAREPDLQKWAGFNGADSVIRLKDEDLKKITDPVNEKLANEIFGAGSWKQIQDTM